MRGFVRPLPFCLIKLHLGKHFKREISWGEDEQAEMAWSVSHYSWGQLYRAGKQLRVIVRSGYIVYIVKLFKLTCVK